VSLFEELMHQLKTLKEAITAVTTTTTTVNAHGDTKIKRLQDIPVRV
jgi:hypothetical protein